MAEIEIFKCPSCKWEGQYEETELNERVEEDGSGSYWEHYCPKCKTVIG
jgi:phage FluMu protein Com